MSCKRCRLRLMRSSRRGLGGSGAARVRGIMLRSDGGPAARAAMPAA